MDWICCLPGFLHHKDSRKFDVCLDLFIFISQLFTNFHGFIPSVCNCWRIHLRDVNYMVVLWILCCFNKWCFDFFSKCPICKFGNYGWNFIMLRNRRLVFFWSVSSFNFRKYFFWRSMRNNSMYFICQDSFSGVPKFSQWFLLNVSKNEGLPPQLRLRFLWCHLDHLGGSLSDSQGPLFFFLMSQCWN